MTTSTVAETCRPAPQAGGEQSPARGGILDSAGAIFLLVLAFLLASFTARNSDLWLHLAAGRALLEGQSSLGSDPFAYTTGESTWINSSWLFDVALYGLYRISPGALVFAKAILLVILGGVLVSMVWRSSFRALAALGIGLAFVAMAPGLELRPALVSYLFLGLTLYWLERPAGKRGFLLTYAPLLILFALWVNLDEWFILGPLAVGTYAVGQALRGASKTDADRRKLIELGVGLVAGLAACLLNPHHWRIFLAWPALLQRSPLAEMHPGFMNVWDATASLSQAFLRSPAGLSFAGNAYFLLFGLGLLSFLVNLQGLKLHRFLLFLTLGLGSWYRVGLVPFFAVVAGPMLGLNLQELAARRRRPAHDAEAGSLLGMIGSFLACLLLLGAAVTAWPGWLYGAWGPRGWGMEGNLSLERAARQLGEWRRAGQLAQDANGFNLSPVDGQYLAWYGQKSFYDGRFHLFSKDVIGEYAAVQQSFLGPNPAMTSLVDAGQDDWREIFRKRKINHLILSDPMEARMKLLFQKLLTLSKEWKLVYLEGDTAIFAWHDPGKGSATAAMTVPALDLHKRAWDPDVVKKAPPTGPARDPEPRTLLNSFSKPNLPEAPERDEAAYYLDHFSSARFSFAERQQKLFEFGQSAALIGQAAMPPLSPALSPVWDIQYSLLARDLEYGALMRQKKKFSGRNDNLDKLLVAYVQAYQKQWDDGPPGSLFLAIRAARRAVQANPDDPRAHFLLGQAYLRITRATAERLVYSGFPALDMLRRVQAITALKEAVRLKPDFQAAHRELVGLYQEKLQLDQAWEHAQELLKYARAAGPLPTESRESFDDRIASLESGTQMLEKAVRDTRTKVEAASLNQSDILTRAMIAEANGLPGMARELLLASSDAEFGRQGAAVELRLLLDNGQYRDVRRFMDDKIETGLGSDHFHQLRGFLAAAVGDYEDADEHFQKMVYSKVPDFNFRLKETIPPRQLLAFMVGAYVLNSRIGLEEQFSVFEKYSHVLGSTLREQSDLMIFRGVLALEAGELQKAEHLFQEGLNLWSISRGDARTLAHHYLALLHQPRAK
jgi:tetratricopeptide (TPR) repeat protein